MGQDFFFAEGPITLDFDSATHILSVTIGEPLPYLTEQLDGSTYLRVDPDTVRIHGLEIHFPGPATPSQVSN